MAAENDALAEVYEWLVPDNLLEPEGAAAALDPVLEAARGAEQQRQAFALAAWRPVWGLTRPRTSMPS